MESVLLLGATGNVGRNVAHRLTEAGERVRRATRTPSAAIDCRFDWHDDRSWAEALAGVDRLFVMTSETAGNLSGEVTQLIALADDVGVERVVLLSAIGVDDMVGDPTGMAQIEAAVIDACASHSIVRANTFMENFTTGPFARSIIERDAVIAPVGNARVSFVCAADIARVVAHELSSSARGGLLQVTGDEALTFFDCARTIGETTGRTIDFFDPGVDGMRSILEDAATPPPVVDLILGFYATLACGAHALTTSTVADLTGDAPTSFAEFCSTNDHVWSQR